MIRTHWTLSSASAKSYYATADYYATSPGEWLGLGAKQLGLEGAANQMHFWSLSDNLDPRTGDVLRPRAKAGDRVGLDMTFNAVKSVSIAREMANGVGDDAIEAAHREAVAYTVGEIETDMQARVRVGGQFSNRTTGNVVAYRVTHRDTRINVDDRLPDCHLHDHVFFFNTTWDAVEGKWKAAELGQIKHDLPYYEALYHNRLASNIQALGYGIERKGKAFEIAGIERATIEKFSRRNQHIRQVADELKITNPATKSKLGATTRLGKTKETVEDLHAYYVGRLTKEERQSLTRLKEFAGQQTTPQQAVAYALAHEFERRSVVDEKRIYETAMRRGIGTVTLDQVQAEAKRQGLLVKAGRATTRAVLAEEQKVVAFARDGRGSCRPMGKVSAGPTTLSDEQANLVKHVLTSQDRVILIAGQAGTGKTHALKEALAGIPRPIELLAPSAQASRGVLRQAGFHRADTVASFLLSRDRQQALKNGLLVIDEASLCPIRDLSRLVDIARDQNARLVLLGDGRQFRAVARDGDMMHTLERHAGLPVSRLRQIRRQSGEYKVAVKLLADGEAAKGLQALDQLGWIRTVDGDAAIVDAYMRNREALMIAPTHAEGDRITLAVRTRLADAGVLTGEERTFSTLVPLHLTEAQRGDVRQYTGDEVLQWHHRGGSFEAGQRLAIADFKKGQRLGAASAFSVYQRASLDLRAGDVIRIKSNGKTLDGKHRLDNGGRYEVAGFDRQGNIRLTNGWTVGKAFGHFTHGYVSTAHAAQGMTVPHVLIAMGRESLPAITREQLYVSVSRGRKSATVFTDVAFAELVTAAQRMDDRISATALIQPKPPLKWSWFEGIRKAFEHVRAVVDRVKAPALQREYAYER